MNFIKFYELSSVTRIKSYNTCDYDQIRQFPTLHVNIGTLIDKGLEAI